MKIAVSGMDLNSGFGSVPRNVIVGGTRTRAHADERYASAGSVGDVEGYAAVVLAGGSGRRLGGPGKPRLEVGGVPMLARVLAAVADAAPRVVVGPASLATALPAGVALTCERPHGSGPVAAASAGLALVAPGTPCVALLAADLPFLTTAAVAALRRALASDSTVDGALFVDTDGRAQVLCGVWRLAALRANLAALGDPVGQPVRRLLAGLRTAELRWADPGPPPWYDCDTESDLRTAREWAT